MQGAALRRKRARRNTANGRHRGKVDATGAKRRIQGLYYMGWRADDIIAVTGHAFNVIHRPTATSWIHADTHDAIVTAFDVLVRRGAGPSKRTANTARKRGYVSPYAWDDIDNDPAPVSTERDRELRGEELTNELEWLINGGMTAHDIAQTLGKTMEALEHHAWRWGRNDLASALREKSAA